MARSRRQQIQAAGARARRGGGGGRGGAVARFLRPHTGREAGRVANSQAGTEYNPSIRELRGQAKGSRKRARDIGSYFNQLAGDYAKAQEQGNEAFKTQQDAVSKQLAEASQRSQGSQQEIAAKDVAFAKLLGGPVDTQGAARIAAAGSAAERQRVTLNELPAAEQANFLAALGGRRTAARLQGFEERKGERARRDKILSDLSAVRKEKGQAKVLAKEKIREADRAQSQAQKELALKKSEAFTEKPYERAIREQAQLGLQGTMASAGAQRASAKIYARADRRTAHATEAAARQARRGHEASARGQVQTAKTYGKSGGSGGYNTREAQALLSSAGKAFKNPQAAVNYLVNRGVKLAVARKAVHAAVGGGGGGKRRRGTGTAQGGVHR